MLYACKCATRDADELLQISMLYELCNGVLTVRSTVAAFESVDAAGMPFSIGNHVTFKFPFSSGGS